MADTWPVSKGSVGTKGSANKVSSLTTTQKSGGTGFTSQDARNVEALRQFNEDIGGGPAQAQLTPGERRYAQSKGYIGGGTNAGKQPKQYDDAILRAARKNTSTDEPYDDAILRAARRSKSAPAADNPANANAESGKTFAGTTPAPKENFLPERTSIENLLQEIVQITTDSFLQGLPGGLSSIIGGAVQGLTNLLPGVMGNLLSTTSLTNVFGNVLSTVSGAVGDALGGLANGLVDAGKALFEDIGGAISNIPGLGPIVQDFSGAVKGLGDTLSTAYKGLDPGLKAIVDGSIAGVGAKVLDKIGLPSIDPTTAGLIAGGISFATNPANNIRAIAGTSRQMDAKIFPQTGNNTFGSLAASAELAANELDKVLTTDSGNIFSLTNAPVDSINDIRSVINGAVADIIPEGARLFDGIIFGNERVKFINGKTYVLPR